MDKFQKFAEEVKLATELRTRTTESIVHHLKFSESWEQGHGSEIYLAELNRRGINIDDFSEFADRYGEARDMAEAGPDYNIDDFDIDDFSECDEPDGEARDEEDGPDFYSDGTARGVSWPPYSITVELVVRWRIIHERYADVFAIVTDPDIILGDGSEEDVFLSDGLKKSYTVMALSTQYSEHGEENSVANEINVINWFSSFLTAGGCTLQHIEQLTNHECQFLGEVGHDITTIWRATIVSDKAIVLNNGNGGLLISHLR